jgi:alkanesulfonate monooxygenase SsuD/methylene tetrahydromethanopterin reductase-like flavin-dependent oxidoreductase (luciferase family)
MPRYAASCREILHEGPPLVSVAEPAPAAQLRHEKVDDVEQIARANATPVGFVHELANYIGADTEITRDEFFEHGLKSATAYDRTIAGTPAKVADYMEEVFEATGSRGGFMFSHPVATPRDLLNVVDFLVPELRRRGRFRDAYEGRTLMENLAT